jgi:potassium efflux system protein
MHVRDLGDRNPVIDEINRFINREFKKEHINISFRQMEVYLKNLHGEEYKLVPLKEGTPEATPVTKDEPIKPAPKDAPEPPELRLD